MSQEQVVAQYVERFGLEDLDERDLESAKRIALDLAAKGWFKASMFFRAPAEEMLKVGYLSALHEQNWMILRQLARLNRNLEALKQ